MAIVGVADLEIQSLADLQQFADDDGVAAAAGISSAMWPLFGQVWPSARHLAAHVARREVRPAETILELGCGLALASLVAHRRGADVTASDHHPEVGGFLARNLVLNHLPPMKYCAGAWGEPADAAPRSTALGRFQLVMASDVLYQRADSDPLAGFIAAHAAGAAEVWIVDPDRGNRVGFRRAMAARGFAQIDEARLVVAARPGVDAYRGRLLTFRGPAEAAPGAGE
ncbi:MAG: hypothetical protein R3B06_27055 [Kofleriaceae bacterium]